MKLRLLFALMALMMLPSVTANEFYDFKVDGIAYKINDYDSTTVSVSKEQDPNIAETNYTSYADISGTLSLPEQVTYDGITYTVTAIGLEAFQGCAGLTGELVLPKTIIWISDWAFYQCSGLTGHLVIPDGVISVGWGAFSECNGLDGVTLPASLQIINDGAFDGSGQQRIVSLIDDPLSISLSVSDRAFNFISNVDMSTCHLVVPAASLEQYQSLTPWKKFEHIDVLENVDGNGDVDIVDVNNVINVILETVTDTQQRDAADVNGNGVVDIIDLNRVINAVLGVTTQFYDPTVTIDMAGEYNTDMQASTYALGTNGTFYDRALAYNHTDVQPTVTIEKIAPGIFKCSDLFGGFYYPITNNNSNYRYYVMNGFLRVDNAGNVTLISSNSPGWQDGLDFLTNGHYDATTGKLSYDCMYAGVLNLHVVLNCR